MESRLPRPNIALKKMTDAMNANAKNDDSKTKYDKNAQPKSFVNKIHERQQTTRPMNENKVPVKGQSLVRSKTLTTITTRQNNIAVKRTATTMLTHDEPKKPFIKPVAKALVNRPNNASATNSMANKVLPNDTSKVKKWDLRGRLAQSTDKLTVLQQKNKDIESKHKTLLELTDALKTSETRYKAKTTELEVSNTTLTNELQTLRAEMTTIREHEENVSKRCKELEESYNNLSQTLEELRKQYKVQESLVLKQSGELATVKQELVSEKDITKNLNTVIEELQTLSHKMHQECKLLHNNIQELKGNIRVFCRVRPRTPKEVEQMKM